MSTSSVEDDVFDSDAYLKASKALSIIFILLILLVNGLLIVKNVRKLDFIYKPKTLTILSLAIGDVFLALFPMVVKTKILFGDYILTGMSCSLVKSTFVYTPFLITFVYSIGLMVLGFQIILSHHNSLANKNTQIIYSLAYSSLPWILGLIIVLPLGMTNYDDDTCRSFQTIGQGRALVITVIILPVCGAVITSIFVVHGTPQTATIPAQGLVVSTNQTTAFTTQTSNPDGAIPVNHGQHPGNVPPPTTQGQYPYYPQQQPQVYYPPPQQQTQLYNPPPQNQPQLYNPPPQNQPQVYNPPPQNQPQVFYQPPQQPYTSPGQMQYSNPTYYPGNVQTSTSPPGVVITPTTVTSTMAPNLNRLLNISMLNFFLVMPIAIFWLSYFLNPDHDDLGLSLFTIINDFVFWLSILRSVITPLMMYGYSDN